jgi:hypothetical protein
MGYSSRAAPTGTTFFPKGTKLDILEWVSFVPASDVEFKRLAGEFGKLAGVDVTST